MTTNIERAAEVLRDDKHYKMGPHGEQFLTGEAARSLADAGLLMTDNTAEQWLVQIGYRNAAGQTDIVEGSGNTREEAVANAQEQRMLATATEVVRGFAKRHVSQWQPEAPIYTEQEVTDV